MSSGYIKPKNLSSAARYNCRITLWVTLLKERVIAGLTFTQEPLISNTEAPAKTTHAQYVQTKTPRPYSSSSSILLSSSGTPLSSTSSSSLSSSSFSLLSASSLVNT